MRGYGGRSGSGLEGDFEEERVQRREGAFAGPCTVAAVCCSGSAQRANEQSQLIDVDARARTQRKASTPPHARAACSRLRGSPLVSPAPCSSAPCYSRLRPAAVLKHTHAPSRTTHLAHTVRRLAAAHPARIPTKGQTPVARPGHGAHTFGPESQRILHRLTCPLRAVQLPPCPSRRRSTLGPLPPSPHAQLPRSDDVQLLFRPLRPPIYQVHRQE